jgi:hypothetical protein
MAERIGWANSVTQLGCGVDVFVGGGEGVMDGAGVLLTVGVKLGAGVTVDAMDVNAGVGCGEKVLHDDMTSIMIVRTREINFVLENVLIYQFAPHCFSGSAARQNGSAVAAAGLARLVSL